MNGRALHHVALGARDVERVAAFYREVFGLAEIARHRDANGGLRSIWLDAAGVILMIERTSVPETGRTESVSDRGVSDRSAAGPFLLAFRIEPAEKPALERELEKRGAPIESRTDFTSYARDPEGNRVAVCHYSKA